MESSGGGNMQGGNMMNRNMQGGQNNYRGSGMNGADDESDIRMNMGGSGGGNAHSSN